MKDTHQTDHRTHHNAESAPAAAAASQDGKLSPEEINRLPAATCDLPIHVVSTRHQLVDAVRALQGERLLGFDTETRPSFRRGQSYRPALLQLAGRKAVYLFQLRKVGLPSSLTDLLANPRIVKAGVAVGRDVRELRDVTDFEPAGFIDLGTVAMRCGLKQHGLRGLAALLLGLRVSKRAQLTNWELSDLPPAAIQYAAVDALIGRRIHEEMKRRGMLAEYAKSLGHARRSPLHKAAHMIRKAGGACVKAALRLTRRTTS